MPHRTLGVEEELLLVDPGRRQAAPGSLQVRKLHSEHHPPAGPVTDEIDQELFRHQIEVRTDPAVDVETIAEQLRAARRSAGEAARRAGLAAVASGTAPTGVGLPRVSPDQRYRHMVDTFGEVALTAGTCGMHVHVEVASDEEGVAVIDRIAPWLPVLLAISANSPFADGRDTGYASWRSQLWGRWPSAGPTEAFGSVDGYRSAAAALLASGAARDEGMLYFDARLARHQPTVEVRVLDVCAGPDDAALLAALTRGLVEWAARCWEAGRPVDPWRSELLRAAQWRAARWGLSDSLVNPRGRDLRPAREVLRGLVSQVADELAETGDLDRVETGLERVLRGNGATRQRAAYERTGTVEGVVDDLVERSELAWADTPSVVS